LARGAHVASRVEASAASIWRVDGDQLRLVAHHGPIHQGPVSEFTIPLVCGTVNGRAVLDQRTVHIADVQAETKEFPETSQYAYARQLSHRTILSVPVLAFRSNSVRAAADRGSALILEIDCLRSATTSHWTSLPYAPTLGRASNCVGRPQTIMQGSSGEDKSIPIPASP